MLSALKEGLQADESIYRNPSRNHRYFSVAFGGGKREAD
jgi:hypothetical protein